MGVKDKVIGRLLGNADKFSKDQVAQTLQLLLEHGVKHNASSIHIEPHERYDVVRYRIDNALRGMHKLPRAAHPLLMNQLKQLAGLDPATTDIPQEGEFETTVAGQALQIEVSMVPVFGGEKVVLHLTTQVEATPELEHLGFWGEGLAQLREALAQPHGLILVAGPRRSGVSTTLHSLLDALNNPTVSIATMEPKILHHIPGATQVITPRVSEQAANRLQALFGHDPNIVMCERISDKPLAEQALRGAMQGHAMLCGIHADDSVTGLTYLRSFGVEPYILASVLRASISQRLVRQLCTECRERYELDDAGRKELEAKLGLTTPARRARVHELEQAALAENIGTGEPLGSTTSRITHLWRARSGGCETCHHTGYRGLVAITEVLAPSEKVRGELASMDMPSAQTIRQTALKDGFTPMALDGLIKNLRGQTTMAEVLRAVAP